ncbi:MAG TPA: hypothetical protein VKV17_00280 [Bryobacteraceae bacterium]|nr:hypothetical protein [Bryobacteraceae bacterium]
MRRALVNALAQCADGNCRFRTRRFLAGLSRDELQFLADYEGASILEFGEQRSPVPVRLADRLMELQSSALEDQAHKMLLLREFLRLSGHYPMRMAMRAGQN